MQKRCRLIELRHACLVMWDGAVRSAGMNRTVGGGCWLHGGAGRHFDFQVRRVSQTPPQPFLLVATAGRREGGHRGPVGSPPKNFVERDRGSSRLRSMRPEGVFTRMKTRCGVTLC